MNLGESGAVSIKGNSAKLGGGISQEAGDCSISLNSNVTIENNEAQIILTNDILKEYQLSVDKTKIDNFKEINFVSIFEE